MALVCAAESCRAHEFDSDNCNLVFFPFPDDEETCRAWVLRSGRHDFLGKTVEEIHLTEFLCERHFEDHSLDKSVPVALKPRAKPSVFDHDINQFAQEIAQEKAIETSTNRDIVVIPCVIMEAGLKADIRYKDEMIKGENLTSAVNQEHVQLVRRGGYMNSQVLPSDDKRINLEQEIVGALPTTVQDTTLLGSETLIVDSIHAVESSDWQDNSLSNIYNQICRVCATENSELISLYGEQSMSLQIIDKIQWHLPIVPCLQIKEDDKLPLQICTACMSLLNAWHDLVTVCVQADEKLRKMLRVDAEKFDTQAVSYCDLPAASCDKAMDHVSEIKRPSGSDSLVEHSESQDLVIDLPIPDTGNDGTISMEVNNEQTAHFVHSREITINNHSLPNITDRISSNETLSPHEITEHEERFTNRGGVADSTQGDVIGDRSIRDDIVDGNIKTDNYTAECEETVDPDIGPLDEEGEEEEVYEDEGEEQTCEEDPNSQESHYDQEEARTEAEECSQGDETITANVAPGEVHKRATKKKLYFCNNCQFSTSKQKILFQHISHKHSLTPSQCNYCDKTFLNEIARNTHERSHHNSICFVCEYCGRSFRSKKTLKEHNLAFHSDEKPYKCDKCDKNYGSLSSLDIHKATHSSETPYLCDLCGKTFKHVSNLRSHKRSHLDDTDKNRQICFMCGKGFRSRFHLSEHMNVHNGIRPYSCEVCKKRFHKKIQLRQHGSAHSGTQPYKCPICGVKFNRRGNMTQHIKRHSQERKYTCRVCSETFPTLGSVLIHRKKHTEEEVQRSLFQHTSGDDPDQVAFKCEICGKLLAKKESLSIHMRSHTGEKLFECVECGKRLSNKGSLTYHMRSFHTGERPYVCQFCGVGFLSKEARLVHERIHTGEKPYNCSVCNMAFRCSSNLAQHARVHSDTRPHPCHTCGKRFQRKGALDVHMRTHTGERPYACDICGRAFTQKNDMLKHRRTHTHEKPFRCDECGNIFAQKKDLTKHRLSHAHEQANELQHEEPTQTIVITAFPEMNDPVMEHTQSVFLHRF